MSDTLTDPLLGRVIDGRYEVRERIAAGGMATVYLAFDRRLERDVALKVMHRHLEVDPNSREFVARFRREAKAAARLTHPGVVRVYDQGVDADVSYLTMEYVDGENLREVLAHEGTLSLAAALTTVEQVLDALASAHRQGLVHQDVKPENVLIDSEGRPRVADFGLARAVTEVTSSTSGTILGTVAYLGPELITNGVSDARTDVYATGVLLYELVTGRQPHTGTTAIQVATKHVHDDVPAPSTVVAWLPPEIDELVASLTARDPEARPQDAGEALQLVRRTRGLLDEPTLDRRADPPSGSTVLVRDGDATAVLESASPGSTVALPIGLGHPFAAVGAELQPLPDDDPEAREPQRAERRAGWWIAAVIVALLVLGGGGLWWYNSIGPGAYTTVPSVVNETEEDATAILKGAGLTPDVERTFDDVIPDGFVISTDPGAQQRVLNDAVVTVTVSKGPRMTDVPKLVGRSQEDAEARLAELELPLGDVSETFSDTIAAGEVMSITPEAGESVPHDTPVSLEVSAGPAPIEFPQVTGMTEDEAVAALEADDYSLDVTVEHERTEEADKGIVFAQTPGAGEAGHRLDSITITVSDGPPLVTVDNYVGMDYDEAVRAANASGLKVTTTGKWSFLSDKDKIVDQNLQPGIQVERGTDLILQYD
ncbi:Stk1 family PASTA domain-containing Ser/Thr kinase [Demequina iriomotensis]|uniref:Stk1 family PASTA domain-containing Ser/Thr kinase n=1 Tax=Demequina iriomotensis TaxID=1536641 RepID=UPI0012E0B27E|nr:Stk1 family PASTA domain-containing Ser/Thr kinase [Demequina iriomotensis]